MSNLLKLRPLILTGELQLGDAQSNEAAYSLAANAAKTAGIEMGGGRITKYLEVCSGLGIGVLTAIALHHWIGWMAAPVILATEEGLRHSKVLDWAGRVVHNRPARLREIGAGRIRFKWEKAR